MTNLEWLSLSNNIIADVSALSGMTNLTWLSLSNNLIAEVSALSGMTHLNRWIFPTTSSQMYLHYQE